MSDNSTNSATSGYLKGKQIQSESKKVFLNTERTVAIRKGSIVRIPEVLGGLPLEGRVLFVGDTPNRGLMVESCLHILQYVMKKHSEAY